MDVDRELNLLEDGIRRLKIEYEIFFNGGSSKMPFDLRWRVESLIKKHGDYGRMTFAQRFRYNTLVAKFHSYSDLWRRMIRSKEEGKPVLGAMPTVAKAELNKSQDSENRLICQMTCADPDLEEEKIRDLFKSLIAAKQECGEPPESVHFEAFKRFLTQKTAKIKQQLKCELVSYSISIESGKVKFSAKPKT